MKTEQTKLDESFDKLLNINLDLLAQINQLAIRSEQEDIKSQSSYLFEIIDTILSNRNP